MFAVGAELAEEALGEARGQFPQRPDPVLDARRVLGGRRRGSRSSAGRGRRSPRRRRGSRLRPGRRRRASPSAGPGTPPPAPTGRSCAPRCSPGGIHGATASTAHWPTRGSSFSSSAFASGSIASFSTHCHHRQYPLRRTEAGRTSKGRPKAALALVHGTNGEIATGWDNARSSFARRCPGWIPPGAQTSAAPSGPAPPESLQACDSKLGPPPFSGPGIEANRSVALNSAYRSPPRPPAIGAEAHRWTSFSRSSPRCCSRSAPSCSSGPEWKRPRRAPARGCCCGWRSGRSGWPGSPPTGSAS